MAGSRELKITILGEDRGGAKALGNIEAAASKIGPSTDRAVKGFQSLTTSLTSNFGPAGAQAKTALDKIGVGALESGGLMGTALAGGAVVAGAALAKFALDGVAKFSTATAEVRKLKATMGSTAEEASGLRNVAKALGIDTDALAKGMFKLSINLEKTKGDFAGVHVETARNADGSANLYKTLLNTRAAYEGIHDPQQKNIFLQQAMSKGGAELRAIMSMTNKEFEEFKKRGPSFNDKDLKAGRDLAIAQRELSQAVETLQISLAKGLVPALTVVAHTLATVANAAGKVGSIIGGFTKAVDNAVPFLGKLDKVVGNAIGGHKKHEDAVAGDTAAVEQFGSAASAAADDVKALEAAVKKKSTSMTDLNGILKSAASAERGYEDAQRAVASASQRVTDAQQKLSDVHAKGAVDLKAVESATRRLADSQEKLSDLQAKGAVDAKAVASAEDALASSTRSVGTARERLVVAETKLAKLRAGSDPEDKAKAELSVEEAQLGVVDASNAVVDAEQAVAKARDKGDPEEITKAEQALAHARLGTTRASFGLTDAQKSLNEINEVGKDGTEAVVSAEKDLLDAQLALTQSIHSQTEAEDKLNAAREGDPRFARDLASATRDLATAQADLRTAQAGDPQYAREIAAASRDLAAAKGDLARANDDLKTKLIETINTLQDLASQLPPGSPLRAQLQGLIDQLRNEWEGSHKATLELDTALAQQGLVIFGAKWKEVFDGIRKDTGDVLSGATPANRIAEPPGRAHGGPVRQGRSYIVGEHRPELFVAPSDGEIRPSVDNPDGNSGGGIDYDRMAAAIARAMGDRKVEMTNHFSERSDPMHVARELAWQMAG